MGELRMDDRPRCQSLGDYLGEPVPCDLHAGHGGKHEWAMPMTGPTYVWTDKRRAVRDA